MKKDFVREQFDRIAGAYDRANRVFSFGRDVAWRRRSVRRLGIRPGDRVLDVCGGTGDLALLAAARAGATGLAVVADISREMLLAGRERPRVRRPVPGRAPIRWLRADAERLPFAPAAFDAVTAGFGIRNLADLDAGLREMHRVLRPGGRLLVLEFAVPPGRVFRRLYHFYSFRVMPLEGRLLYGDSAPARYLVTSIRSFPAPAQVASRLRSAGFTVDEARPLTRGVAFAYLGTKPPAR